MIKTVICIVLGILLICTIFPPISLHVMNFFVLIPAIIGAILILLPLIKFVLKFILRRFYKPVRRTILVLLCAAGVFFLGEFLVIFVNSFPQATPDDATVIVLGAKVSGKTPTIMLQGRIDAAGKFLKEHPKAKCIAAGGKGSDERISEADCIKEYLIKQYGIDEKRIYTDPVSVNTQQNLRNSKKIIKENNLSDDVAVVTDGFHIFRAKMIAKRIGLKPYSCPASTDRRLVHTFYLRELFALPKSVVADWQSLIIFAFLVDFYISFVIIIDSLAAIIILKEMIKDEH